MKNHFSIPSVLLTLSLLLGLFGLVQSTQAQLPETAYYEMTREPVIIEALKMLAQSPSNYLVDGMYARQAHIMFKDLSEFNNGGYDYSQDAALTNYNFATRSCIIYINQKHLGAPAQAIAAIIAHESLHSDTYNSLQEEVTAWTQEAQTWEFMKQTYLDLQQIPQGAIPLIDRLNANLLLYQQGQLETHVKGIPVYQTLQPVSPGFGLP